MELYTNNELLNYIIVEVNSRRNEIFIPSDVKKFHLNKIKNVTIKNEIKMIENCAFTACSLLEKVNIEDGVTKIGNGAFQYCSCLTSINIPNSVKEIGIEAFRECNNLTNINIPNSIIEIKEDTFRECINLKHIIIPKSVTKIGTSAFYGCKNLTEIIISEGVKNIEYAAFCECEKLTDITLPNSLKEIGEFAIDDEYIQNINLYSYNTFLLLDDDLKQIAILSTIKNYYTGKIKYTEKDIELFKKYIIDSNFDSLEKYKELINFMIYEMDNFFTQEDISKLLSKSTDAEVNAMLLEYSNNMDKKSSLDEYDLGELDDEPKDKQKIIK